MTRLWSDSELQAAHSLVESVMTPASPPGHHPIPFQLTAKRQAFEEREKARHARLQRQQRKREGALSALGIIADLNATKGHAYLFTRHATPPPRQPGTPPLWPSPQAESIWRTNGVPFSLFGVDDVAKVPELASSVVQEQPST